MLSLPDKLLTAAMEVLERVRVGLDIPSRAEVLTLAERLEAISNKIDSIEIGRQADSQLLAQLRDQAARVEQMPSAKQSAGNDEQQPTRARTRVRKSERKTLKPATHKTQKPGNKNEASASGPMTRTSPRTKARTKVAGRVTGKKSGGDAPGSDDKS